MFIQVPIARDQEDQAEESPEEGHATARANWRKASWFSSCPWPPWSWLEGNLLALFALAPLALLALLALLAFFSWGMGFFWSWRARVFCQVA